MTRRPVIFQGIIAILVVFLASCESSEDPIDVCAMTNLAVAVSSTANSTCGEADGSITVSGSGGSSPYMFSIDGINFQTTATFELLGSGIYTVTITDANECESTVEANVTDETTLAVSVSSTNTECGTEQGSITASATGGTMGLMYRINDGAFQGDGTFDNLAQGIYNVTVMDDSGCEISEAHMVRTNTSWSGDILPIITTRCALSGCHDGQSGPPNWTNLPTVQSNAERIKMRTGAGEMPPDGAVPLTGDQIALIACWVDDGAINN